MHLEASLKKIMESEDRFGDLFYKIFFERYPETRQYFEDADMQRQSLMLTMSIRLMGEYHAKGYPAIKQYLKHLGTRHSDRGVPRDVYPQWCDALLAALDQFHGNDWNDELADEWREAVDATSKVMFDGYDRRTGL